MSNNAPKTVADFDQIFFTVLKQLEVQAVHNCSESVLNVLDISTNFLSESAQQAAERFHSLYFNNDVVEDSNSQVNDDIDDILNDVQTAMAEGRDITELEVGNEEAEQARLALSSVQKELEAIMSLDKNITEQLVPIMSGMQFEDMMTQRLAHIEHIWQTIVKNLNSDQPFDAETIKQQLANLPSSVKEKVLFHKTVLHEELDLPEPADDAFLF